MSSCIVADCQHEPAGDYPACALHAETVHFTNRADCRCRECSQVAEIERVYGDKPGLMKDLLSELPMAA